MPLFEWKNEYSVGVSHLDGHHKKLINFVNTLHDAMKSGKGKNVVDGIIKELAEYTEYHFGEEERLMERIKYKEIAQHKQAHRDFILKVKKFQSMADEGRRTLLSMDLSRFLADWLLNHIGKMDKRYGQAMNDNGIK